MKIATWTSYLCCCLLGAGVQAQSATSTYNALTPVQRIERRHLQATHEARMQFARERIDVPGHGLYEDFPAVIHAHAEDAEHTKGTRQELLAAARKAGIKVVLMSDHRGPGAEAWNGMREGVLVVAGFETEGALWFPELTAQRKAIPGSGLRFLSHVERRYDAATEGLAGMEICNRHSDAELDKSIEQYLAAAATDANRWKTVVENFKAFPDEFFAADANYREKIFKKWDSETQQKHFTGIGANDAHQNRIVQGITFDPYEVSFRNLVTHILGRELTEAAVREALSSGHVYVAHDWLANPVGFAFGAVNNLGVFGMGDTAPMLGKTRVTAIVPVTAVLRLIHNGTLIKEATTTNLIFEATETGTYRLEAWLKVDGELRPWIYSNPVYLRGPTVADMKLPPMDVSPEVKLEKDLEYQAGPEEDAGKHKLDVYSLRSNSVAPVLFFVHGGAWKSGDRAIYRPLGNRYAREGFVTVVPSYRLAPKHPHPAQIEDVAAAFAWTVQHIAQYGGDTNRIYAAGHSAGAHLVALLGLDKSRLEAHHLSPKMIRGVLAFSGIYNLGVIEGQGNVFSNEPEVRRNASPLFHVNADAPPFLVTFCEWDYFTLPAQARRFYRALSDAQVNAELVYVAGENHLSEMINVTQPEDGTVTAAVKFMQKKL